MSAYYNENDRFAAAWLRELIKKNLIVPGEVDERSIEDVKPDELKKFTQCHFFAGIGGWSYALRLAGWPDDRSVWTGSCPCQPFSSAGQRKGVADKRHLWPVWFNLIRESRPPIIFGEQVSAAIRQGWWDTVQRDLEGEGYACGMGVFGAHSVGAPHIRQRCYFVGTLADAAWAARVGAERRNDKGDDARRGCKIGFLADAADIRRLEQRDAASTEIQGERAERTGEHTRLCGTSDLGNAASEGLALRTGRTVSGKETCDISQRPSDVSFWTPCDWLPCRDAKSRPVEPGTFPLAHGVSNRVGLLRGYGNAIVPQVAAEFIKAYLEC